MGYYHILTNLYLWFGCERPNVLLAGNFHTSLIIICPVFGHRYVFRVQSDFHGTKYAILFAEELIY